MIIEPTEIESNKNGGSVLEFSMFGIKNLNPHPQSIAVGASAKGK